MVRTKADAYTKAGSKAPRKHTVLKGDSVKAAGKNGKSDKNSGGNAYCPRPTPAWQKPITAFFPNRQTEVKNAEEHSIEGPPDDNDPVPCCSKDNDAACSSNKDFKSTSSKPQVPVEPIKSEFNSDESFKEDLIEPEEEISGESEEIEVEADPEALGVVHELDAEMEEIMDVASTPATFPGRPLNDVFVKGKPKGSKKPKSATKPSSKRVRI